MHGEGQWQTCCRGEGLVVSSQRYEFWPSLFYLGKRIPFIRWLTNNTVFSNDSVMMRFLNYVMRMSSIDNSTLAILGISRIMTSGLTTVLNQCRLQTPAVKIKRYMVPEWMEEQE